MKEDYTEILSMLPREVRMEEPEQFCMEDPPRTQQMDKEGQTGEEDLYSEKSCCSSCGFYYGERHSESHVEEFNTEEPFTPPNEEKDDVLVLQGMFERIIHNYKEINREASVTLDTMLDELHKLGARKYIQTMVA